MKKILVTYATNSGSTKEIAEFVAAKLSHESTVDVASMPTVIDLAGYDAVIVGAPMILGIHSDARKFLHGFEKSLTNIPYACFFTAMNVTAKQAGALLEYPVSIDPNVEKQPVNPQRLSFKENYAKTENYLKPLRKVFHTASPIEVAFFGGKLEIFRLKLLQALFVMFIIQAKPGDLRNWPLIENWTNQIAQRLTL